MKRPHKTNENHKMVRCPKCGSEFVMKLARMDNQDYEWIPAIDADDSFGEYECTDCGHVWEEFL